MSDKYALIGAEKADPTSPFTVTLMCLVLAVSSSAFYAWTRAETSARAKRRAVLKVHVQAAFDAGRGTYGVRRVHAMLTRSDVPDVASASPKLVRSVMAELGLKACQPRAYKRTTIRDEDAEAPSIPDLLGRDFSAPAPGVKLVGDITYIRTWQGWLYLATVLDCHTKQVIGYAMADHLRTPLVIDALAMAARNVTIRAGVTIFHSDRGCQYTSQEFADATDQLGLIRSLGRTGTCYDNARAESFNGTLKNERVNRTVYPTKDHARIDISRYIELRYNQKRLHSALGYITPNEAQHNWFRDNQAA